MNIYWLTLAISEEDLAKEIGCEVGEIQNGDYIGDIRDYGEVVSLKVVEDPIPTD